MSQSTNRPLDPRWIHHLRAEAPAKSPSTSDAHLDEVSLSDDEALLLSIRTLSSGVDAPALDGDEGASLHQCYGVLSDEEYLRACLRVPMSVWVKGWDRDIH